MSKRAKQTSSKESARVKVEKLMRQDKELKNPEAQNIRGGGGAYGGVLGDKSEQIIRNAAE